MEILIIYKKGHLKKGMDFFHQFTEQLTYYKYDRIQRIIELYDGSTIQLLENDYGKLRGRQCQLIFIDNSITIENIENEIFGKYEEAIFF